MEPTYLYSTEPYRFDGRLLFWNMTYETLFYRVAGPKVGHYLRRFDSAVAAQNFADEHNLEYFGVKDEHPMGCICGLRHGQ
jgi:hypothetical protein